MPEAPSPGAPAAVQHHKNTVKETLISLVIAFALAFVFRGFVVEAFLIPTGSMAPTLNGAHMRFRNPMTGHDWAVGPRDLINQASDAPYPFQGSAQNPIRVRDPNSLQQLRDEKQVPIRAGDRIFVMKYLYSIFDPQRFDVVVFKNPTDPQQNFIKRLIGLPGEMLALIDGDVWTRTPRADDPPGVNAWKLPGWTVARKPERAQREMWQTLFDSQYAPVSSAQGARPFQGPWVADAQAGKGWQIEGRTWYEYTGKDPACLKWDYLRVIRDYYPYNEVSEYTPRPSFPVGDLCISFGIKPEQPDMSVSMVVAARRHEFRANVHGTTVDLEMRPRLVSPPDAGGSAPQAEWTRLVSATLPKPLEPGKVTNVEFWHVDQSLQFFVEQELVTSTTYDWSPDTRLINATNLGEDWEAQLNAQNLLTEPGIYQTSEARIEFAGGAFSLYRVALRRDIFYRPENYSGAGGGHAHSRVGEPALATSPRSVLHLGKDQFFCCGDNSPASLDGRLWDSPDPWVGVIDPTMGIVHRNLLIGKAFFVYFPAPIWKGAVPIPDFGRMRFTW